MPAKCQKCDSYFPDDGGSLCGTCRTGGNAPERYKVPAAVNADYEDRISRLEEALDELQQTVGDIQASIEEAKTEVVDPTQPTVEDMLKQMAEQDGPKKRGRPKGSKNKKKDEDE